MKNLGLGILELFLQLDDCLGLDGIKINVQAAAAVGTETFSLFGPSRGLDLGHVRSTTGPATGIEFLVQFQPKLGQALQIPTAIVFDLLAGTGTAGLEIAAAILRAPEAGTSVEARLIVPIVLGWELILFGRWSTNPIALSAMIASIDVWYGVGQAAGSTSRLFHGTRIDCGGMSSSDNTLRRRRLFSRISGYSVGT